MTEFIKIADSLLEKNGVNADDRIETKASKHTPGPWEYTVEDGARYIRSEDGKLCMCDTHYYPWIRATDDDWRLIAAAPDLLEALNELLDYAWTDNPEHGPRVVRDALAAIAKAEGSEHGNKA